MRPGQRPRRVQRPLQLVVPAVEGAVVAAEHLQADLQGLLQPLEALGDRRERDAEPAGLLLVPRRADAEPRPAAGQHVERSDDLREDPGVAVGHAGDQGQQFGPRRVRGQVAERGVGLEHLVIDRADRLDLEEVVHHGEELEAGVVRGAGHGSQVRPEPGRAARRGEVWDLQSDLHAATFLRASASRTRLFHTRDPGPGRPAPLEPVAHRRGALCAPGRTTHRANEKGGPSAARCDGECRTQETSVTGLVTRLAWRAAARWTSRRMEA